MAYRIGDQMGVIDPGGGAPAPGNPPEGPRAPAFPIAPIPGAPGLPPVTMLSAASSPYVSAETPPWLRRGGAGATLPPFQAWIFPSRVAGIGNIPRTQDPDGGGGDFDPPGYPGGAGGGGSYGGGGSVPPPTGIFRTIRDVIDEAARGAAPDRRAAAPRAGGGRRAIPDYRFRDVRRSARAQAAATSTPDAADGMAPETRARIVSIAIGGALAALLVRALR